MKDDHPIETTESIWSKTAAISASAPLVDDLTVDAAVIGGGLAGILAAHFLREAGLRTVVLEASHAGSGQTKNTTAKITSQHGLIYHRLIQEFGIEKARQYAEANQAAIEAYRSLIASHQINCEFTECPSFLYTTAAQTPLRRECEAACSLGIPATLTQETELPFPVTAALRFERQARFHPLKFLQAIAQPLEIYSRTTVTAVKGTHVETPCGAVTARHILFACHYPFINVPGYYFMRMHQERSYVIALAQGATMEGMYLGIDSDGFSFRPHGAALLLGCGNHRTGENAAGGQYNTLRNAARRYFPGCSEITHWSAQDCMTLDGIPYIGRFSAATPNWYVATGFQKWGMTSSMVSALLIRDLIVNGESPWEAVFSPQRFTPSPSAKALMEETAHAAKGLARKLFVPPAAEVDALAAGHGGVVSWNGEKVGVYKDETGTCFAVSVRCPHLGCQLEWNPEEKSWDCPCHGSRFDYRGNLIDGPAQEDLQHG